MAKIYIIYFPLGNQVFEIRFVEHENPFYQLGKLNVFKLQCETFEYSHEEIDVGIAELDNIEDKFSYQVSMVLGAGSGDFQIGEVVTQTVNTGKTVSGNVVSYTSQGESTKTLKVNNITFSDTDTPASNTMFVLSSNANAGNIVGATSNATRSITTAPDQYALGHDPLADNKDFETAGANIIDFSESNPFGSL